MKKFIFGIIALVALVVAAYSYWEENRVYKEVKWTNNDISMKALVYKDEYDMTIEEKYEALSASAVTKSIDEKGFMMAGRMGEDMRYFEKHLLVKPRTWLYLRVEFPKDQTWAADPLLQYVKAYEPYYLSQALRR